MSKSVATLGVADASCADPVIGAAGGVRAFQYPTIFSKSTDA